MQRALLYSYRRCPYAMRARMALLQAGIEFELHEISLRDKPAEMLKLSPKGTVPVIVLPDGQVIDQSLEIVRWAFTTSGDVDGWWARSQTTTNRELIDLNDGPFKPLLDRYKYPERYASNESGPVARDAAVTLLLTRLEEELVSKPFLGGDAACAGDLAIFPFVRQFRAVNAEWFDAQALPSTQRWLSQWLESDLFERCMIKPVAQK